MDSGQSSNIIYITNQCNIDCDYCYQKQDRSASKESVISEERIESSLNKIMQDEQDLVSTVVIFGGEPFLHPNLVYKVFDYANELKSKYGKKFALSTTTNGLWFYNKENAKNFVNRISNKDNHFSLEISYDASGHDRRVDKNGVSTKDRVLVALNNLKELNFPVTIRYTVHKDNYMNFAKDMIHILSMYKNAGNLSKIVVSIYHSELERYTDLDGLKSNLKDISLYIYSKFNIPICELACDLCKGCNIGLMKQATYFSPEIEFSVAKNTQGEFNHFTKE